MDFVRTPMRCRACKHAHFWKEVCGFEKFYPGFDPFHLPCRCVMGASLKLYNTVPTPSRRDIPGWVRAAVIRRDGHVCQLCGCKVYTDGRARRWPRRKLTLDHIIHYSAGGADTVQNLRVACLSCNTRRGGGELPGWPLAVLQIGAVNAGSV